MLLIKGTVVWWCFIVNKYRYVYTQCFGEHVLLKTGLQMNKAKYAIDRIA